MNKYEQFVVKMFRKVYEEIGGAGGIEVQYFFQVATEAGYYVIGGDEETYLANALSELCDINARIHPETADVVYYFFTLKNPRLARS